MQLTRHTERTVPVQVHTNRVHHKCEAMIPFKGRLGFKQYMKDKPTVLSGPSRLLTRVRQQMVACTDYKYTLE